MAVQTCLSFSQKHCCLAYGHAQQCQLMSNIFLDDLPEQVRAQQLRSVNSVLVLNEADYQLLVAKKPDVPTAKLLEALLWQEQARFSQPLDQLVLDYFPCYSHSNEQKLYLTAVNKEKLNHRFQLAQQANLHITRITIPELIYTGYMQQQLAQYSQVVWVNIFPDQVKLLLLSRSGLATTLRLPKLSSHDADLAQYIATLIQSLQLFYHEQVNANLDNNISNNTDNNLLWVINSVPSKISQALLNSTLPGNTVLSPLSQYLPSSKVDKDDKADISHGKAVIDVEVAQVASSHAVFGLLGGM